MSGSGWRRVAVGVTVVAVLAGISGCGGGGGAKRGKVPGKNAGRPEPSVVRDLVAASKKTAAAGSARVRVTVRTPMRSGDRRVRFSGVIGWDPPAMDVTRTDSAFADSPVGTTRLVLLDDDAYVDIGAEMAESVGGKRWMKTELRRTGEQGAARLGADWWPMKVDPAEQLALLLDSPDLEQTGSEEIGGVRTRLYRGRVTRDGISGADRSLDVLSKAERVELGADMRRNGIGAYSIKIWADRNGRPVKTVFTFRTRSGIDHRVTAVYDAYGTHVDARAPKAEDTETVDVSRLQNDAGADSEG